MSGPTPGSTVVCRQCGTTNTAGDQFCGNCGTFLEWSSEPADGPAPAATAPDSDPSLASLLEQRPADPSAGGAAVAGVSPPPAAPSAPPGLVRCPTCGTANEAGKTFCLRCGNKLAGAAAATRLPLPPRSEPGVSGTVATPTSAVPRPTTTARRREPADKGPGISGWVVVAGAGIAVGAIAVVVALMLGSGQPPPPAAASSAPSASVSVSSAPGPSASSRPSHAVKTPKPKPSK
jgi:double zinc ribbon protein